MSTNLQTDQMPFQNQTNPLGFGQQNPMMFQQAPVTQQAPMMAPATPQAPMMAPVTEQGNMMPPMMAPVTEQAPMMAPMMAPATPQAPMMAPMMAPATPQAPMMAPVPEQSNMVAPVISQAPMMDNMVAPVISQAPMMDNMVAPVISQAPMMAQQMPTTTAPEAPMPMPSQMMQVPIPQQGQTSPPIYQQQMMNPMGSSQPISTSDPITNVNANPSFVPYMNNGEVLICKFSPAKFDAFVKVLSHMDDKNAIVIRNSEICQAINNGTAIVKTSVASLIDSTNSQINLHILNPKKYIKLFKNIKGASDIHILDDSINSRFIVTNGDLTIYLPKQIEAFEHDTQPPDLSTAVLIGQTYTIEKDVRSTIISMSSDSAYLDLLIHQNQFKAVYIPETAIYSFKEFIKEQITDAKADLRLRAYSFLKISGEEYQVSIGEISGTYWIITIVNTGFSAIHILECIQPVSDDNLII